MKQVRRVEIFTETETTISIRAAPHPLRRLKSTVRFPNESDEYRSARNDLLEDEAELLRLIERVAAKRRELPLGGIVAEDYVFDSERGPVRMSQLFAESKEPSLILYSYMFGPRMETPCASCTSILDALDGEAPHVDDKTNFAVVAGSPIARIAELARNRGWRNLRLLSSANNTYQRDYRGETEQGDPLPMLNVFTRRAGRIHHFWSTELLFATPEPGRDGRHADMMWSYRNLFDIIPEARGKEWFPRLRYW